MFVTPGSERVKKRKSYLQHQSDNGRINHLQL